MNRHILCFIVIILINVFNVQSTEIDENGYLTYCPCMGRFGNQADHFLGALAFTKALNRTLILPPWVEYRYGETRSIQVPFDTYFDIKSLIVYHKVITMETFFETLADRVWPSEQRVSFCYTVRIGSVENSCNAKDGNPFGPFWDTFNVEFTKSEFYAPLHYDIHRSEMLYKWQQKYTAKDWPVLAFTGAPASFPVQDENRPLQKYLKWNKHYTDAAASFIKANMSKGAFIGIHLRNGADWTRACQHVPESPLLFAAPQCVGYKNEKGPLTASMCFPSKQDIVRQLKRTLKQVKDVKHIFVASDANHMIEDLREALRRTDVISVLRLEKNDPHLDLAILGSANHFIGNCVSSYSAFVKRERDVRGLPTSFWAFPALKIGRHEEL